MAGTRQTFDETRTAPFGIDSQRMPREHHVRVERTARYFTLGPVNEGVRELWFVLHGYGNLAAKFLRSFEELDDGSRRIVAPEALNRFYLVAPEKAPASERPVGASWMTREDRESEIVDYIDYLDVVADEELRRMPATVRDALRIRVLGFSQGTATAARWVSRGQLRPHQLICWGGGLPPDLELAALDGKAGPHHTSLLIVLGSDDKFATPALIEEQERRLREAQLPYNLRRFEGGHYIDRAILRDVAEQGSS
jgi:predicted esterase